MILQIALDTPLRRVFDYRPPAEFAGLSLVNSPRPQINAVGFKEGHQDTRLADLRRRPGQFDLAVLK